MSQNNPPIIYLGIDVAKAHLDVDSTRVRGLARVENRPAGHRQIIKALQAFTRQKLTPHIVVEATGGYEQPLVEALRAAQIRVSVIMPARARQYAQALGRDAKTDPIDAAVLSAFGAAVEPPPTPPLTETESKLRALTRRRRQLLQIHTQELNRDLVEVGHPQLRKGAARLLAALKKEIAAIDLALRGLEKADPAHKAKVDKLCEIDGVGALTATATLAALPELGTLNRREAGSLAGLAPKNRDSGSTTGRRYIRGGRSEARQALYMAAMSAAHRNPVLKPFYQQLCARGKAPKLALTAVMRRLLIHMNSLLKPLVSPPTVPPLKPIGEAAA